MAKKFKNIQLINIFNKSSYQLTHTEHILLSLGNKFKIPLQLSTSNNIKSWHRSVNKFQRQLDTQLYFSTIPDFPTSPDFNYLPRFPSYWNPPTSPYSIKLKNYIDQIRKEGVRAIHHKPFKPSQLYTHAQTTLGNLKQNRDIIIKPADKNVGLVILNTIDYKNMCLVHLTDTTTYRIVNNPEFEYQKAWTDLKTILVKDNRYFKDPINDSLSYFAKSLFQLQFSTSLRPAPFYCLPKIHKNVLPIPGRPIASAPSTITYYTSLYINNILKPLLPLLPTICQSSSSALQMITTRSFPSTSMIFTADVKSLYPSIPTIIGLDCVKTILELSNMFSSSKIQLLINLMNWVLTNNFILFDNTIYLQTEGTAMGTPMAPTYAIIFMYAIERHHIRKSLFYLRYIDDIFAIFNSVAHANEYLEAINSFLPDRLKLEAVVCGQEGIFLDIHFKLTDGNLSYQLFQKPHNTYAYIPTLSDHPRSMFKSFVLEELKRYYRNCSDFITFTLNATSFRVRLKQRGYHSLIFNTAYATLLHHLPINVSNSCRIPLEIYPLPQTGLPAVLQKSKIVLPAQKPKI